jgi:hypothetical protein
LSILVFFFRAFSAIWIMSRFWSHNSMAASARKHCYKWENGYRNLVPVLVGT